MKHLLVYGTLRLNSDANHNFGRFGPQKLIDTTWVYGYHMHNLGPYPAATKAIGNIFCEIHEVDEKVYDFITRMEKNAGYEVHEHEIDTPKGKVMASLYAMPKERIARCSIGRIMSGDWNEREVLA